MHIGYYGKLPHRGDFVRFNLPKTFLNVWDDWMQGILIQGEQQHGDSWGTIYSHCPGYRFALDENLAGAQGWAGVVLPSVDKVGRRFPFCIAAQLPSNLAPTVALAEFDKWFVELEKIAINACSNESDYSMLQQTLETLAASEFGTDIGSAYSTKNNTPEEASTHVPSQSISLQMPDANALSSNNKIQLLLNSVLRQSAGHYSVWSSLPSAANNPGTVITQGLPVDLAGLALFDGDWLNAGVEILPSLESAPTPDFPQANRHQNDPSMATTLGAFSSSTAPADHQKESDTLTTNQSVVAPEVGSTVTESESESLSTGDWSALEMEDDTPVVPVIEKLDIDDDTEEEPW